MSGAIVTRPARPGEGAIAAQLVADAGLPLDGLDEASVLLVADEGGAIVGVAALEDHGDGDRRAFLLRSVATLAERRGEGIGAALTQAALRRADAEGVPVALLTETADAYFPRFGFVAVERGVLPGALTGSKELQGACDVSARSLLRPARAEGH